MAVIERASSGIPGLDPLLDGGFVKGSTVLVTGGTGTGKTTFCAQFLWHGLQNNEPGVYVTLEEDPEDIKKDMTLFGWDFSKFAKKKIFKILYQNPFEVTDIASTVMNAIESVKAKRVVLDPISLLGMYMKDDASIRKRIAQIVRIIKKTGCTSLITSEVLEGRKSLSRFGVVEFVVDGVLVFSYLGVGSEYNRSLMIRKMRRTKHGKDSYPFTIEKRGISIGKTNL